MSRTANMVRDSRGLRPLLLNLDQREIGRIELDGGVTTAENLKSKPNLMRVGDMARGNNRLVRKISEVLRACGYGLHEVFRIKIGAAVSSVSINGKLLRCIRGSLYIDDVKVRNVTLAAKRLTGK